MARFNFRHLLLLTAAVHVLLLPSAAPDIASDRASLLAFRDAVGSRALDWNLSSDTPCSWTGVKCSLGNSSVVELRLPASRLSGLMPPNTISNMTNLRTISLRYNNLSGPLPADFFSSLTSLRKVYLKHNFFSGQIPDSFFSLTSLVNVDFAENNFSGPLSPSFAKLTRLRALNLQNNNFSGPIPDLNSSALISFNVSYNNLSGQIPGGLSGNPKSSFSWNSLCGDPLDPCGSEEVAKRNLSGAVLAEIIVGSVVGVMVILMLLLCLCKMWARSEDKLGVAKGKELEFLREGAVQKALAGSPLSPAAGGVAKEKEIEAVGMGRRTKKFVFLGGRDWDFDLQDLLKASAEVLGKGTYGTTYKAMLEEGMAMAVKRLKDVSVEERLFREMMEVFGRMDHENLVRLRAYYYNRGEKLLVYDYMPLGSLSSLLHGHMDLGGGRTPLNWKTRVHIARGAARGILYLHSQGPSISHGNIKSSNILLTESYDACVSDFGLAQLAGPAAAPCHVAGYRAPEVTGPHGVSHKADVYSFGVLLLELITGKAPTNALMNEEGVDLTRWVMSVVQEEEWVDQVFDLELLRYQNVEEDMVRLLQLAVDCTEHHPDNRPSMAEVAARMEELCNRNFQDIIVDDAEELHGIH